MSVIDQEGFFFRIRFFIFQFIGEEIFKMSLKEHEIYLYCITINIFIEFFEDHMVAIVLDSRNTLNNLYIIDGRHEINI